MPLDVPATAPTPTLPLFELSVPINDPQQWSGRSQREAVAVTLCRLVRKGVLLPAHRVDHLAWCYLTTQPKLVPEELRQYLTEAVVDSNNQTRLELA